MRPRFYMSDADTIPEPNIVTPLTESLELVLVEVVGSLPSQISSSWESGKALGASGRLAKT
jgi:hypothetical protein